jgi:hypothetical protein
MGANAAHGLKRTKRDKRNADDKMLTDLVVSINDDGVHHHGPLLRAAVIPGLWRPTTGT